MTDGALIIAAGFSRRFGSDKRLFKLTHGDSLLIASVRPYCAVFANVAVVVRSSDSELTRQIRAQFDKPIIIPTDRAQHGMAASIADGVLQLCNWDYLFLGLGDMPYIRTDTLERLRATMEAPRRDTQGRIIVPHFGAAAGHPVGFSREFFIELIALTGDRGARSVIDAHPDVVDHVSVDDPGVVTDIDAPPE